MLQTFDLRRIIPDTTPIDLDWVGDASMTGISVLIGQKSWAQFELIEGWNLPSDDQLVQNIAWAETVAIRLGLIIISQIHNLGGKKFIVLTENTTLQSVVDKRRLGDRAVNGEWKAIQKLLLGKHANLVAHRVKTGDNMADLLSRVKDKRDLADWILIKIPIDLITFVRQLL